MGELVSPVVCFTAVGFDLVFCTVDGAGGFCGMYLVFARRGEDDVESGLVGLGA